MIIEEGGFFSSQFSSGVLEKIGSEIVAVCAFEPPPKSNFNTRCLLRKIQAVGVWGLLKFVVIMGWKKALRLMPIGLVGKNNAPLKSIARSFHKDFFVLTDLNASETLDFLNSLKADVFVTSVSQILKQPVLSVPKIAVLNKHAALLPSYGGLSPVFHAVIHGEKRVGMTVHEMSEAIDEGRVLCQRYIEVKDDDTIWNLTRRVYSFVPDCFAHAIEVLRGCAEPELVQPRPNPSYYSELTEADWKLFSNCKVPFI